MHLPCDAGSLGQARTFGAEELIGLGPLGTVIPFPAKMRLLEHWNLRDEIKADYSDRSNGLLKQRIIQRVMERIALGIMRVLLMVQGKKYL